MDLSSRLLGFREPLSRRSRYRWYYRVKTDPGEGLSLPCERCESMVLFHAGRPSSARHGRNHYADYEYGSAQRLLVHFFN